jgi:diaminohydroxyphosphoribosylaminopyrimidine deaminase / 5-amino-6-(5-phosphoribosylamino)uracil reductase
MHRCLELAKLGRGNVAPNPMVGAILVHENKIIGEGYHQVYGEAHAEVNCINSVAPENRSLISQASLYVSLEPCAHFGKTPPCADLIIKNKIPEVVVGCRDPFVEVNGKGIEKLKQAGIAVIVGVLEKECKALNKRFFIFHTEHRPYIILKWAQTADRKIAKKDYNRLLISGEFTNHLVHKWRSEETAICIGTNTALSDNPELTTRLWPGNNPIRIVIDMNLCLPGSLKLFDGSTPTIVFNLHQHNLPFENISVTDLKQIAVGYYQVTEDVSLVHQMLHALYRMNIQSILIEGGAKLLQSFINEGMWDEARIITNKKLTIGNGLVSPTLSNQHLINTQQLDSDTIEFYQKANK